VYVCREKKKTILCVSSSLCVSKWIYVNVPLSFLFFIIFFVVLITKRINDIPNWLIETWYLRKVYRKNDVFDDSILGKKN
jgi:hypothetical protein